MTSAFKDLSKQIEAIESKGLYRTRRIIDSPQDIYVQVDGRRLLNFCSNDYLGLANHPDVKKAFIAGIENYGVGSGSAHLICGHSRAHHELEEELAEFTGRDRVLLFSSGYMANLGVISALVGQGDVVFEDRLNHASLLDGGLLSSARFKRYRHADIENLTMGLEKTSAIKRLIATDGVFSMDGDLAPMVGLARVAAKHNAWLMLDDAHGLGVLGNKGGGSLELLSLSQQEVPVLMGTLGKGFGTFGAFVAGSELLIETLIQKARTYIYTTALPPAVAEATRASLKRVRADTWRRDKLQILLGRFCRGARQLGLQLTPSQSAIQAVLIGDNLKALACSAGLLKNGILVSAIRPPTVPAGSARLRVTFSAMHEPEHVDRLLEGLEKVCYEQNIY